MKIVDEKGKLFGKINLIDLLVILALIVAIAAVIWKVGGSKAVASVSSQETGVRYTVVFEDVQSDICAYAESQIGKNLVNSGKTLDASIVDFRTEPSSVTEGHKDLYLTIDAAATFADSVYSVGSQEVRVGFEYIVKTSEFELTGLISDLEVANG